MVGEKMKRFDDIRMRFSMFNSSLQKMCPYLNSFIESNFIKDENDMEMMKWF